MIMIGYFVGLYLISFSNHSLQSTEDGVIGSHSDQDVLEWIYLTFHDPAEELRQVFDEWKMALMRGIPPPPRKTHTNSDKA